MEISSFLFLLVITTTAIKAATINTFDLKNYVKFDYDFNKENSFESINQNEVSDSNLITQSSDETIQLENDLSDKNSSMIDEEKREKVKEMMQHAWRNYKLYAWGENELKPISKRPHTEGIFGAFKIGATIVDSLDTLYIMGMKKEFDEAREWIENEFSLDNVTSELSIFETNIRFVGGFLSAYALTGDVLFKEKAQYVADKLLPAFETPSCIPYSHINFQTNESERTDLISLAEVGTLHLEFAYLSDITGNPVYREKVMKVRKILRELKKPRGLYPSFLNPTTGHWGLHHMSIGANGDSFYEYLLKAWIQSGQTDDEARQMFDDAMMAIIEHLVQKSSQSGLVYVAEMTSGSLVHRMYHVACFAGGLFGLGARTLSNNHSEKFMEIAEGITKTCHESYTRTKTGLGPEVFWFDNNAEVKAKTYKDYILRPETIESYFIMWRLTHDQKYRDWGWDAMQAIEKHCRSDGGYGGVKNVNIDPPQQDDVMHSFFLAETLKYLYLLFSDDSLLSLDEWVFNTEAHPLPIKNLNSLYRLTTPT